MSKWPSYGNARKNARKNAMVVSFFGEISKNSVTPRTHNARTEVSTFTGLTGGLHTRMPYAHEGPFLVVGAGTEVSPFLVRAFFGLFVSRGSTVEDHTMVEKVKNLTVFSRQGPTCASKKQK